MSVARCRLGSPAATRHPPLSPPLYNRPPPVRTRRTSCCTLALAFTLRWAWRRRRPLSASARRCSRGATRGAVAQATGPRPRHSGRGALGLALYAPAGEVKGELYGATEKGKQRRGGPNRVRWYRLAGLSLTTHPPTLSPIPTPAPQPGGAADQAGVRAARAHPRGDGGHPRSAEHFLRAPAGRRPPQRPRVLTGGTGGACECTRGAMPPLHF